MVMKATDHSNLVDVGLCPLIRVDQGCRRAIARARTSKETGLSAKARTQQRTSESWEDD
jgi:hypothetical protein